MQPKHLKTDTDYKITTDPSYNNERLGITPKIQQVIQNIHGKLRNQEPGLIQKLKKLCKKYPQIPQFKNYLTTAYKLAGNTLKAHENNKWTREEHPDYLYGKINLCSEYLEKDKPEKVPEILGEQVDIQALYPERDVFHLAEVLTVHKAAVRYYLAIDNLDEAQVRLEKMEKLDYDHFDTEQARNIMNTYYIDKAAERLKKEQAFGHSVQSRSYDQSIQTQDKPSFTHPEIEALYSNGMHIHHAVLKELLALPRETLVQDLETVLQDSIHRFEYFRDKAKKEGWDEKKDSFPLHALFLLAELKAKESLPAVLNLLRQGEEFLDFWFSDLLTEMVWEIVYHLGQDNLEDLKAFLMEPDLYTFARNTVNKAVAQMALHHPDRVPEITDWYADLFECYLANTDDVQIIDTNLISFMVWYCIDIKAKKLIPTIKKLFEQGLVNPYTVGTFAEVKKDIAESATGYEKKETFDIYSRYEWMLNLWSNDQPKEDLSANGQKTGQNFIDIWGNNSSSTSQTFERDNPKVGRNDPCPCGSGRKYKHCCMK